MSRRILISSFEHEEDLLRATSAARGQGWHILDAHTPYAVHGLNEAMGLRPSRLPWVCFVCGLLGTVLALWFQSWASSVDWPLNVGGRPWNSLPAFVPVAFEVMVLLGGLGVVFAFLLVCRLFPGKQAVRPMPGVTDCRFVLLLRETETTSDLGAVRALLRSCNAVDMEERVEEAR